MGDGKVALILDVIGLAKSASVLSTNPESTSVEMQERSSASGSDSQTLLVVEVNEVERCAIPLSQITRLEKLDPKRIEISNHEEVIQYRNCILPLMRLYPVGLCNRPFETIDYNAPRRVSLATLFTRIKPLCSPMNPNYDDVAAIAQHVLQTMARLESEPAAEVSWKDADLLLGKIQIQGAWAGEIQIRTTEALAKQLAEQMLQVPSDDLQDEDIKDVLAEVTNLIGGNIKSQLDSPSPLTLPCVATELGRSTSESNDTLLCNLHILCRDNPLSIQILSQK